MILSIRSGSFLKIMNDLAELWADRQKRKVKPYSRYGNASKNNKEITKENKQTDSKEGPLTSKVWQLIDEEIREKLNNI